MRKVKGIVSIFGDPGAIAPSVDKTWRDDFIVELRMLSVPGDRIGDALMTVETHVSESGESAEEAFGGARDYARDIAGATGAAARGWAVGPGTVVSTVLGLLGMLVTVRALTGWLEDGPVHISVGELVGLGVLLLVVGALFFTPTLRVLVEHRWTAFLLPAALVLGVVTGILALGTPLFTVPAVPLGVAGVLLLVVGAVLSWADSPADADEITAPGRAPTAALRVRLVSALVMPLMTVLLLAFTWILHSLT